MTAVVITCMMLVPGCGEPSEEPDPLELTEPEVFARDDGTTWVYDTYMLVDEVNMDDPPRWEDLRISVHGDPSQGLSGSTPMLIQDERPRPLPQYPIAETGVYYYTSKQEGPVVDTNSGFWIIGMSLDFRRAQVSVNHGTETLGYHFLPDIFPVPPCYFDVSPVEVMSTPVDGEPLWEARWKIKAMRMIQTELPWWEVRIVVQGTDGLYKVLGPPVLPGPAPGEDFDPEFHGTEMVVWYHSNWGEGNMTVGDTVRITAMTKAYEGAKIEMKHGRTVMKSFTLPEEF